MAAPYGSLELFNKAYAIRRAQGERELEAARLVARDVTEALRAHEPVAA